MPDQQPLRALIYDIEIKKAIPPKNGDLLVGYAYCEGWHDHANMGISVICAYDYVESRYRAFCDDNMHEFAQAVERADVLVGFNNIGFDNKVIAACWEPLVKMPTGWADKSYDLLREIWIAAGLAPEFSYPSHVGYGLDEMACRNFGATKTGNGAMAPIYWQHGAIGNVIDYCLNDIRLTKLLFDAVLQGAGLICPKTDEPLFPRHPLEKDEGECLSNNNR